MPFDALFDRALRRWMDETEAPPMWSGAVQEMARTYYDRASDVSAGDLEATFFALLHYYG